MKIESTHAQITVSDNETGNAGGNIHRRLSGYACDISFWDGEVFLCRRKGDPFLHIVLVPRICVNCDRAFDFSGNQIENWAWKRSPSEAAKQGIEGDFIRKATHGK